MKSILLALFGIGVLCLISTTATAVEVIEQTLVFNLDTPEAATMIATGTMIRRRRGAEHLA